MVTKLVRLSLGWEGEIWAKGAWVKEGGRRAGELRRWIEGYGFPYCMCEARQAFGASDSGEEVRLFVSAGVRFLSSTRLSYIQGLRCGLFLVAARWEN